MSHQVERLRAQVAATPDRTALVFEVGRAPLRFARLTYAEVDARTDALAHGLVEQGLERGMRVVMMIRADEELFLVLLALLKVGAVPVVVDPGMGLGRMLRCFSTVGAEAFVGVPLAHLVRRLRPGLFSEIRIAITNGGFGGTALASLYLDRGPFPLPDADLDDLVMITFTTGSTGPAKGVEWTHRMLSALVEVTHASFPVADGEVGLVTLPLFAVVDLFTGCTAVLAPMDPTRPAAVDPEAILSTIEQHGVQHFFASPALLRRIAPGIDPKRVESVKTVVCGGAPGAPRVLRALQDALGLHGCVHATYGATEALPIASIAFQELQDCLPRTAEGRGVCAGRPVVRCEARILAISDEPVATAADARWLEDGEIGEITVAGEQVSRRYHGDGPHDAHHKIADGDRVWHRTGDAGWRDDEGRLWLVGRTQQIVRTAQGPRYTLQVEGVFNAHPGVERSALVGVGPPGAQVPIVVVELAAGSGHDLLDALRRRSLEHEVTRGIAHFVVHPRFPVDIRHNAKIRREELAVWAGARLGLIRVRGAAAAWMALVGLVSTLFGVTWWWALRRVRADRLR